MNTCSCFLFLLQLVSEFIIYYTYYYHTDSRDPGPTLDLPLFKELKMNTKGML